MRLVQQISYSLSYITIYKYIYITSLYKWNINISLKIACSFTLIYKISLYEQFQCIALELLTFRLFLAFCYYKLYIYEHSYTQSLVSKEMFLWVHIIFSFCDYYHIFSQRNGITLVFDCFTQT